MEMFSCFEQLLLESPNRSARPLSSALVMNHVCPLFQLSLYLLSRRHPSLPPSHARTHAGRHTNKQAEPRHRPPESRGIISCLMKSQAALSLHSVTVHAQACTVQSPPSTVNVCHSWRLIPAACFLHVPL